jgi:hypothetical protein
MAVDVVITDVPAPVWVRVVTVAGRRCQCTGACGRDHSRRGRHTDGDGQCPVGSERITRGRLVAAPADPSVPAARAYRTPAEDLQAWCGPCLDRARRLAGAARRRPAQADLSLF